jgi:hypothetical protein
MKAVLVLAILVLSGCGITDVHTEKYTTDANGDTYERHYLIIPYESKCDGTCKDAHKDLPTYNLKTHKYE